MGRLVSLQHQPCPNYQTVGGGLAQGTRFKMSLAGRKGTDMPASVKSQLIVAARGGLVSILW